MSPYGMGAGIGRCQRKLTPRPRRACPRGYVGHVGGSCVGVIRSVRIQRPNHSVDDVGPTSEMRGVLHGANLVHGPWCSWGQCRSGRLHSGGGVVQELVGVVDK